MHYWLLKSEPHVFSIADLNRQQQAVWDGVRNYQARNHLRTANVGDLAFFYHSSADPMGIAGLCKVTHFRLFPCQTFPL
jgi:predicted RNA-binding protein with PUA-like domain